MSEHVPSKVYPTYRKGGRAGWREREGGRVKGRKGGEREEGEREGVPKEVWERERRKG